MSCATLRLDPLKRGDTFGYSGKGKLPAGTWTAAAQVRMRDRARTKVADLVCTLDVIVGDPAGYTHVLALEKDAETSIDATKTWPIETLQCDVEFRDAGGVVRSTQTFEIPILEDVTHA